jgi:hypothetical protein
LKRAGPGVLAQAGEESNGDIHANMLRPWTQNC